MGMELSIINRGVEQIDAILLHDNLEENPVRQNLAHINQDKFYGLISEVFQEVYRFDDTIYNNIKIGKPDATKEEIIEAADKAQVLDFA
nr:hypothetical protein [Sphingobacterium sp. ML3W]